jgi:hypothetical protein
MSAYEEFKREKREIDDYLQQGFAIVSLAEDLDGTEVRFTREGAEPEHAVLLLVNPDARKYVTALIYEKLFNRKMIS